MKWAFLIVALLASALIAHAQLRPQAIFCPPSRRSLREQGSRRRSIALGNGAEIAVPV